MEKTLYEIFLTDFPYDFINDTNIKPLKCGVLKEPSSRLMIYKYYRKDDGSC